MWKSIGLGLSILKRSLSAKPAEDSQTWRRRLVAAHFDPAFYRTTYRVYFSEDVDPLDHYLRYGAKDRLDPTPDFSAEDYLAQRPDLSAHEDLFFHFLSSGAEHAVPPTPSKHKLEYVTASMFDRDYYLARYPDVREADVDPLQHYLERGWRERRDPSSRFSTEYYLTLYDDVRASGVNPLFHYASQGAAEGRRPMSVPPPRDDVVQISADNALQRLAHRQPDFPSKWLRQRYLASGLSERQRGQAFVHHYDFVISRFPQAAREAVLFDHLELWRAEFEGVSHAIRMSFSRMSLIEGELSLELMVQDRALYTLSFSFVPKTLTGSGEGTQALISRLQGPKDRWDEFKQCSRRMKDVSGPFALMAALQGVAEAFGVERVVGTPARRQPARMAGRPEDFETTYDRFFSAIGLAESAEGFFEGALPLPEKALSEIKRGHRIRTRVKRQIKHDIARAARLTLQPETREQMEPAILIAKPDDVIPAASRAGGLQHAAVSPSVLSTAPACELLQLVRPMPDERMAPLEAADAAQPVIRSAAEAGAWARANAAPRSAAAG